MKKLYFVLIGFLVFGYVEAQIINFPDANFKAKLLSASVNNYVAKDINYNYITIDSNSDGEIDQIEANQILELYLSGSNISNLIGIIYFSNLQTLDCSNNQLTNLNVNGLTNLNYLDCYSNHLSNINLNGLPNLYDLNCKNNLLTSLNVGGLTGLSYLDCNNNHLLSINLNGLPNLINLNCSSNQLTSINVGGLTSLSYFVCSNNLLPSLNLSGLTNLSYLTCNTNQLTSINVSGLTNLQTLYCYNNLLPSINVSDLSNLSYLNCYNNQLQTLDVSGLTNLIYLNCFANQLSSLNVSDLTNLQTLYCSNNQLNTLFLKNGSIENTLDFYNNPNLQYICADDGQVTSIQTQISQYGYTNCTVSSTCSLANPTFVFSDYFTLSPVPAKDILNITAKQESSISSISIYNTLGQVMLVTSNPSTAIDVSNLATGSYFIKVLSDKGTSSGKFMKE